MAGQKMFEENKPLGPRENTFYLTARLYWLLDGIISGESSKSVPGPRPICLTFLPDREFTTPAILFYHDLLAQAAKKYSQSAPRLSAWMEENIEQGLTIFSFPQENQRRLRTTNLCERLNREIKRRTRVVGVFPNARSLERLVTAVFMEMSEDWQSSMRYLTIS
jgi:hypothetical protein